MDTQKLTAIPIAADQKMDRDIVNKLTDDARFDALDTGSLANSWRQQPGGPVCCAGLKVTEMQAVMT